jgi:ribosomal protein S18 acetylase RimI-like enzyme
MPLVQRDFCGSTDWPTMLAVVRAQPSDHLHVVDLPYRLCSWAFDQPANCSLWQDADGQVLAWAVLQSPFWSIDYALHPAAPLNALAQILSWADQRVQAVRDTPFARPMWFINGFKGHQHEEILKAFGFHAQTDVGENSWTKVFFHREALPIAKKQPLSEGFHIRALGSSAEVDAYVALHRAVFQSESMTTAWRHRTLAHPDYLPRLDLVLVDPKNELAGFCIGWFTKHGPNGQPSGQIEPLGIRADVQGKSFGHALLCACLAQLAQVGATDLFVETDNYRDAAFNLYTSAGFQIVHDVTVYRKEYPI